MYKRLSAVLFPIALLLFVGAALWGYREHQDKNSVLLKAENQYQRAFHDLAYHVDQLHDQLGNTLAVNGTSDGYHRKGLVNVWRLTSQAQNEINQLPLALLPFNQTETFLSHVSNFAYKTALRDLKKEPLSKEETATMKTLYASAEKISADLRDMQGTVLNQNLRWMDVEMALASTSDKNQVENSVVDGLRTVDRKVAAYPEVNWGPAVDSLYTKRSVMMLSGPEATENDVRKDAAHFLGITDTNRIEVVLNGGGTPYETYTAKVKGATREGGGLDYAKRSGKLIRFSNPREVGEPKLGREEAAAKGSAFLSRHGYPNMRAVASNRYDNSIQLTYVTVQDGVYIYPEKLSVKIALDNGEIVGLQASDFVFGRHKRDIKASKLTEAQARAKLNPDFRVTESRLAMIEGDNGGEVLCREFIGRINGGLYRIDLNSETGSEETVERLDRKKT